MQIYISNTSLFPQVVRPGQFTIVSVWVDHSCKKLSIWKKFEYLLDYSYNRQLSLVYISYITHTTLLPAGHSSPSKTFLRLQPSSLLHLEVLQSKYHEGLSHLRMIKPFRMHMGILFLFRPLILLQKMAFSFASWFVHNSLLFCEHALLGKPLTFSWFVPLLSVSLSLFTSGLTPWKLFFRTILLLWPFCFLDFVPLLFLF